jgi:L-fucose mutarotase/ribose pyranase (RbsD/FucU family)
MTHHDAPADLADVQAILATATDEINQALEALVQGKELSVADVQKTIESLCDKLVRLPGHQQDVVRAGVLELLVALDCLTNKLVDYKEDLARKIAVITPGRTAATAYTKSRRITGEDGGTPS